MTETIVAGGLQLRFLQTKEETGEASTRSR